MMADTTPVDGVSDDEHAAAHGRAQGRVGFRRRRSSPTGTRRAQHGHGAGRPRPGDAGAGRACGAHAGRGRDDGAAGARVAGRRQGPAAAARAASAARSVRRRGSPGAARQGPPHRPVAARAAARSFTLLRNVAGRCPAVTRPAATAGAEPEISRLATHRPERRPPGYPGRRQRGRGAGRGRPPEALHGARRPDRRLTRARAACTACCGPRPSRVLPTRDGEPGVRLEFRDADGVLVQQRHTALDCGLSFWEPLRRASPGAPRSVLRARTPPRRHGAAPVAAAGLGTIAPRTRGPRRPPHAAPPGRRLVACASLRHRLRPGLRGRGGSGVEVRSAAGDSEALVRCPACAARNRTEEGDARQAVAAAARADAAIVVVGTAPRRRKRGLRPEHAGAARAPGRADRAGCRR